MTMDNGTYKEMPRDHNLTLSSWEEPTYTEMPRDHNLTLSAWKEPNASLGNRPEPSTLTVCFIWFEPLLIITFNLLVFIVIPRMKSINRCTSYGMLSLATTDFCLGILELIKAIYLTCTNYGLDELDPFCIVLGFGNAVFGGVSILTLTFMNLHRLVTFTKPLDSRNFFSKRRVKIIYISLWVGFTVMLIPGTTGAFSTRFRFTLEVYDCIVDLKGNFVIGVVTLVILYFVPMLINLACFIGIFYIARNRGAAIKQDNQNCRVHSGPTSVTNKHQWHRDIRILRSLTLMTFGFYICWTPFFALVAIPLVFTGDAINSDAVLVTSHLALFNSIWNPIIYMLTMRPFQQAMCQLFHRLPTNLSSSSET